MYKQLKGKAIYIYRHENGKNIPLPRALTRHLDGKMDWEIEDWMRWYAALHNLNHRLPPKSGVPELNDMVERCMTFLKSQKRTKTTIDIHRNNLFDVLVFFKEKPDFEHWYWDAGNLYDWMLEKKYSASKHNGTNVSLRIFYRWMQDRGIIKHRHALSLRNLPVDRSRTPLRKTLTPDQVLASILYMPRKELQMMALLGYFFSLRPDEVFGVRKEDFVAGGKVRVHEASKVMEENGLYARLLVNVRNCRRADGTEYTPSARKKGGIVACFNAAAADLIISYLNKRPDGLVIRAKRLPDCWKGRWEKWGIPSITPKDLRRASIYWLGHHSKLGLVQLQHHARHLDPKTTALYYRRPEEQFDNNLGNILDLNE